MSVLIQYDLFEPIPSELEVMQLKIDAIDKTCHKVRKGNYASINELKKMVVELKEDMEIIKRNLCHGR